MAKLPAFQFYPGDWLKDTRHLSLAAKGALIDIMCAAHDTAERGVLRVSVEQLGRYIGSTGREETVKVTIELTSTDNPTGKGVLDGEGVTEGVTEGVCKGFTLRSRRMVRDEKIRAGRAAGGVKGAEFGKCGGRPVQKQPLTKPLTIPLEGEINNPPSSSSSSSSSINTTQASPADPPEPKIPKPRKPATGPHADVIAHFKRTWEGRYANGAGVTMHITAQAGVAARDVLAVTGGNVAMACAAWDRFLADAFHANSKHDVGMFQKHMNRYTASAAAKEDGHTQIRLGRNPIN